MNGDLYFEGEKYISVKRATEISGYTDDYIGQLCRSKKLKSRIVGRSWFISEISLFEYFDKQKHEAHAISSSRDDNNGGSGEFVYMEDKRPLFPDVSEKVATPIIDAEDSIGETKKDIPGSVDKSPLCKKSDGHNLRLMLRAGAMMATLVLIAGALENFSFTKESYKNISSLPANFLKEIVSQSGSEKSVDFKGRDENKVLALIKNSKYLGAAAELSLKEKSLSSINDFSLKIYNGTNNLFSGVKNYFGGFFDGKNKFAENEIVIIKKPSSDRSSSSVSSAKAALATLSPNSSESATYNPASSAGGLQPTTYNLIQSDITRKEVLDLIKQYDDNSKALIYAANAANGENSLTISQSISGLEKRISNLQYINSRQLDKPASVLSRSDADIKNISGASVADSTITSSSFSGTTGTFTGNLSGTTGTFSGLLTLNTNLLMSASAYLNFGTDSGSSGYGIRDNGGTVQFKNSSGSWTTISPAYWGNNGSSIYYNDGNVGIGTTTPYAKLSVVGETVSSYFTATTTTASTFPYASTTALTVSGSAYIGSLNGPLQANNGLVSATTSVGSIYGGTGLDSSALTGLAQIVSGTWSASSTLSTAFGGTGWNSIQANSILLGNGAGRIATTSAGTDGYVLALSNGVPTWLATSTLSTITGTLAVGKGGTGQTSFGQGWLNSDGTALSASTSPTVNYIVATSTAATSTFPYLSVTTNSNLGTVVGGTWQGTAIGTQYGGTGQNFSASSGLVNFYSGTASAIATSSLGLLTTNVAEGTNLYWTNDRFDTRLSATTTLPNLTTLLGLTNATTTGITSTNSWLGTIRSGAWNGTAISNQYGGTGLDSSALTGLAQIVAGTWSASSTLSTAYGGTGWNSIAAGYIPYGNGAAALATSSSFYWDNGNSRLGIGTTTPNSKLTIYDTSKAALEFSGAGNSTYKWTMGLDMADAGKFKIASSTALGTLDKFTIDGNGYVGIGTSTPARRLDVVDVSNPQLRLSQGTTVYTDFSVAPSTGDLTLSLYPGATADDILLTTANNTGANLWVCENSTCPSGITFSGGGNLFVEGGIKYATSSTPKTRRSIILTAAGAIVPVASGAAKTQVDGTNHSYYVLDYDASSDEAAYWQWTMPDSYDDGTIDITYYWEAGATSGNATFCFQAKGLSANSSEEIDSALSSAVCETDGAQTNDYTLASITETNATSNFTAGEYVTFKVFRDVDNGDDMTGDARLVKVKIEYGVATESD